MIWVWMWTVVSAGVMILDSGASSNPHKRISPGTDLPSLRSACMVSTAIKSLAQRNTSGSSGRAERGTSISVECRLIQNASSTGTPARVIAERKAT